MKSLVPGEMTSIEGRNMLGMKVVVRNKTMIHKEAIMMEGIQEMIMETGNKTAIPNMEEMQGISMKSLVQGEMTSTEDNVMLEMIVETGNKTVALIKKTVTTETGPHLEKGVMMATDKRTFINREVKIQGMKFSQVTSTKEINEILEVKEDRKDLKGRKATKPKITKTPDRHDFRNKMTHRVRLPTLHQGTNAELNSLQGERMM